MLLTLELKPELVVELAAISVNRGLSIPDLCLSYINTIATQNQAKYNHQNSTKQQRKEIYQHLIKTNRPLSLKDIAEELNINSQRCRNHLNNLISRQKVYWTRSKGSNKILYFHENFPPVTKPIENKLHALVLLQLRGYPYSTLYDISRKQDITLEQTAQIVQQLLRENKIQSSEKPTKNGGSIVVLSLKA